MTDHDPRDAIRRRARARAVAMGLARQEATPDPDTHEFLEPVPTTNPRVLQQLLSRGHLTPGQAETARRMFAAVRQYVADNPEGD
ncbi:hypothetical protein HZZ00_37425 (plasmid) [Streptomyces sp. NEAU-sy36]|uniref:hypothetical protein n=1 Tax=unclassified Streptomyces TaxID=2593676 RepID=UPI0015D62AA4|nr:MULTISPECIES: hypothetical protein [unclassified Streptomyces]QLJ06715.1 hypothetical protein HZZ00_37425 [Streptomyces sp. NEAU-sy36]